MADDAIYVAFYPWVEYSRAAIDVQHDLQVTDDQPPPGKTRRWLWASNWQGTEEMPGIQHYLFYDGLPWGRE